MNDDAWRYFRALAEPLMLFLIAALVGTIFIGMVIPIFSLQDHIK